MSYEDAFELLMVSISALEVMCGLTRYEDFRAQARKIVEKKLGLKLETWKERDEEGYVFTIPDDIDVDVAVSGEGVILVEIVPRVEVNDVYIFKKKAEFYEKKTGIKPSRLILASPFIYEKEREFALELASAFGIEIYSF